LAPDDLATRAVLWRVEPLDVQSYEAVLVVGRTLYALCRRPRGLWFAYDLDSRQVTVQGALGGYGGFGAMEGRVFSWVHWALAIDELPLESAPPRVARTQMPPTRRALWDHLASVQQSAIQLAGRHQ
jgi:hypothetical protein